MKGELPAELEGRPARPSSRPATTRPRPSPPARPPRTPSTALPTRLPEFLGGSADLTPSNLTNWSGNAKAITNTVADGNYLYYGVREFGMSAIMNGVALHGGFIPFGGTFLMFSEYARNALRMAALMKQRRSSSTPTTPSVWARTARPTSRSSRSPPCA
jgi:transketolase